jgi:uncharacterized protein YhhL (DUF1145 family)
MRNTLKAACLAIYLLAALAVFVPLPFGLGPALQIVAGLLVAAHVAELLIGFDSVRRHPGPLVDSIALTLAFGFLHWLPLRKRG